MEQGTEAWHQARLGKLTASRISQAIAKTKSGWGASRANLMATLVCERLTGCPTETFKSAAMLWGTETEPQARAAYSLHMGEDVAQVGFLEHPRIAMAGCSPDGLVGDMGLLEVKCPQTATHLDTLLAGTFPSEYFPQIQFQLATTGREWCDAVSFDPRLPDHLRLFVERVPRDDAYIRELEALAEEFLGELDAKVAKLQAFRTMARAA